MADDTIGTGELKTFTDRDCNHYYFIQTRLVRYSLSLK
jgi:hypothetical protein